jgi:hypothetical protein
MTLFARTSTRKRKRGHKVTVEDKEAQDKPLWEQQGYSSADEAFNAMMDANVAEKARADALEKELGTPKAPEFPVFDKDAYENDPVGYVEQHQSELERYKEATKDGPAKISKSVLNATLQSVLALATQKGYDEDVVQGTIRSMVRRDSSLAGKLETPDGLRELGKLAMEKLKAQIPKPVVNKGDEDDTEDDEMADKVPTEHRDRPGRSSAGARQSTPKSSEVDRLSAEIETHVSTGRGVNADLVGLIIEKNLAQLGVERPKK